MNKINTLKKYYFYKNLNAMPIPKDLPNIKANKDKSKNIFFLVHSTIIKNFQMKQLNFGQRYS